MDTWIFEGLVLEMGGTVVFFQFVVLNKQFKGLSCGSYPG